MSQCAEGTMQVFEVMLMSKTKECNAFINTQMCLLAGCIQVTMSAFKC